MPTQGYEAEPTLFLHISAYLPSRPSGPEPFPMARRSAEEVFSLYLGRRAHKLGGYTQPEKVP